MDQNDGAWEDRDLIYAVSRTCLLSVKKDKVINLTLLEQRQGKRKACEKKIGLILPYLIILLIIIVESKEE